MLIEGSGVFHVQTSSSVLPCARGCVCTHIKEDRKKHLEGDHLLGPGAWIAGSHLLEDITSGRAFSCMCKAWSSVAH